ncbi:unnamed protein product [marine sediment metagenome]|uniref:Uncharacterized protein n=1 Tax=marine sediment metagenome TaxID=412755 RepID=X1T0A7_9ZZZZ
MTTDKSMIHIYISLKLADKLDDYRFSERINSKSLSVQKLIFNALKDLNYITPDSIEQDYI